MNAERREETEEHQCRHWHGTDSLGRLSILGKNYRPGYFTKVQGCKQIAVPVLTLHRSSFMSIHRVNGCCHLVLVSQGGITKLNGEYHGTELGAVQSHKSTCDVPFLN